MAAMMGKVAGCRPWMTIYLFSRSSGSSTLNNNISRLSFKKARLYSLRLPSTAVPALHAHSRRCAVLQIDYLVLWPRE